MTYAMHPDYTVTHVTGLYPEGTAVSRFRGIHWLSAASTEVAIVRSFRDSRWIVLALCALCIALGGRSVRAREPEPRLLVEIPGSIWDFGWEDAAWESLLDRDHETVFVKHEGEGWSKQTIDDADILTVSLAAEWDDSAEERCLASVAEAASGDVRVVVCRNFVPSGRVVPARETEEDEWAAKVVEALAGRMAESHSSTLVEHGRGSVISDYLTDLAVFDRIIVADPRGSRSLDFVDRAPETTLIDIIVSAWDAPPWRGIGDGTDDAPGATRDRPNVRILELQELPDGPRDAALCRMTTGGLTETVGTPVVSFLQGFGGGFGGGGRGGGFGGGGYGGGGGGGGYGGFGGGYGGYGGGWGGYGGGGGGGYGGGGYGGGGYGGGGGGTLQTPEGVEGGIDFRSVELRLLEEHDDGLVAVAYRAHATDGEGRRRMGDAAGLSWDALFTWLALPEDTFWVNLRPDEPDRIIDDELAKTDAGRILLEADLQMKRDMARLTHPKDSKLGRRFWDDVWDYVVGTPTGPGRVSIPVTFRVWIVPGAVSAWATEDGVYVVEAGLDVKLESDYMGRAYRRGTRRASTGDYIDGLLQKDILPLLAEEVNTADAYRELRQIFYSRIIAEWYRSQGPGVEGVFGQVVNSGSAEPWRSEEPWSPQTIYAEYKKSLEEGEYSFKDRTTVRQGRQTLTIINEYFTGGVDLKRVSIRELPFAQVAEREPDVAERLSAAMLSFAGHRQDGAVWLGGARYATGN